MRGQSVKMARLIFYVFSLVLFCFSASSSLAESNKDKPLIIRPAVAGNIAFYLYDQKNQGAFAISPSGRYSSFSTCSSEPCTGSPTLPALKGCREKSKDSDCLVFLKGKQVQDSFGVYQFKGLSMRPDQCVQGI